MATHDPRVIAPAGATTLAILGQKYTILARGADTGGAFALLRTDVPANDPGPPLHTHTREDEGFYVLAGAIAFTVGDCEVTAPVGTFVFAPRGTPHAFRNPQAVPAAMIVTITPAGFEDFFEAIGDDWTGRDDPVPPPTQEMIDRVLGAAPRFGLVIHPPRVA